MARPPWEVQGIALTPALIEGGHHPQDEVEDGIDVGVHTPFHARYIFHLHRRRSFLDKRVHQHPGTHQRELGNAREDLLQQLASTWSLKDIPARRALLGCSVDSTCLTRVAPFTRCSCGFSEKVQMSWLKGGLATAAVRRDSAIATCRASQLSVLPAARRRPHCGLDGSSYSAVPATSTCISYSSMTQAMTKMNKIGPESLRKLAGAS